MVIRLKLSCVTLFLPSITSWETMGMCRLYPLSLHTVTQYDHSRLCEVYVDKQQTSN